MMVASAEPESRMGFPERVVVSRHLTKSAWPAKCSDWPVSKSVL